MGYISETHDIFDFSGKRDLKLQKLISRNWIIMTINNYWTRLSKILWFVSGEQINYHDILRRPSSIIALSFYHQVCFHILITSWQLREAVCHFSLENVRVPNTHEQNIICSKTSLDGTTHEQTILCRQLFAGHVVGSRPMDRKKNASNDNKLYRLI